MKKTIYLYLCKEIAVPFILGMTTFTFVLLMGRMLKLADLVVAKGVPFGDVMRLVLYLLPYFSLVTIPMAFLLALLLAFGRLSGDSEIIAMKGCGIGLYNLLPPVLVCALAAYLVTAGIALYALPWGNSSFKKLVHEAMESKTNLAIKEDIFNDDFPGMVLYVDRYDKSTGIMHGILIQDERNQKEPTTVFATTGELGVDPARKTVHLQLHNGSIHRSLERSGYRAMDFQEYDLAINLDNAGKDVARDELDMSLQELRSSMTAPGITAKLRLDSALELHRRFALPFACLVFALVGVPLGVQNQRTGKAAGFAVSIGIILLYYIILAAGKSSGERGLLPPAAAVWAPNLVFLIFGMYLFKVTAAEERFFLFTLARSVRGWLKKSFAKEDPDSDNP